MEYALSIAATTALAIVIEDEEAVRLASVQTLELGGFTVHSCTSAEAAWPLLSAAFGGIVVTDVRLPGSSGLDLLARVMTIDIDLPVIVMTGHGHVSMAVAAMRGGAYDFIEKPFAAERLLETASRAREKRDLVLENRRLRAAWLAHPDVPALIGQSDAIVRLRQLIATLGPTLADILIHGQTGTGKEVVARQLHAASARKGPYVAINCGALPESVFESEMFGHEAGAFTGAQKRRIGKLEYASGGTLFLDEIESMPLALQVKLLRVLQERSLERLGGNDSIAIDCRIIAATKVDLLALAAQGLFREDLFYRINVVQIDLPPLNERRGDIALLLAHFTQLAALRYQLPLPTWSAAQMASWQMQDWQGNVRQLRNSADRLVLGVPDAVPESMAARRTLQPLQSSSPSAMQEGAAGGKLAQKVSDFESVLIADALAACGGNVAQAAEQLGLPKKTLYDKLKKHHL
jgi:two-component system C4-dicarboxylate transport response regulator DctD